MEKVLILSENIIIMVILRSIENNKVKFYGEILETNNKNYKEYIGKNYDSGYLSNNEFEYL